MPWNSRPTIATSEADVNRTVPGATTGIVKLASSQRSATDERSNPTKTVAARLQEPAPEPDLGPEPAEIEVLPPAEDPAAVSLQLTDDNHSPVRSLEKLQQLALDSHPAIVQAQNRVSAARARAYQAGLPFNPSLQYQGEEIADGDAAGLHSISLSQQFVTANKLQLAEQVGVHEAERLAAQLQRVRLQVATEIQTAYINALIAQQRVELTEKILETTQASVRSASELFDAMEISKVAVLQAEVEAEQAMISLENARVALAAAKRTLAASAAIPERSIGVLQGELETSLPERPWESLLAEITAESPELVAADSALQRARWALQLACAQVTPNVTGQLGTGINFGSDDVFMRLGVSVPLPIRNRNQGNIRAARADIAASAAAIDRTALDLQTRLADAAARYQAARQRREKLQQQVVPAAEEMYELARTAFEAGESDYLSLLTSQRTLVATRLRALDALQEAKQAAAQIDGLLVTLP